MCFDLELVASSLMAECGDSKRFELDFKSVNVNCLPNFVRLNIRVEGAYLEKTAADCLVTLNILDG